MNKILIYSFEKFAKLETNPAAEVAKLINELLKSKIDISLIILPTWDNWIQLEEAIRSQKPDFILGIGVADRNRICLEYLAINMMDYAQPDNNGKIIRNSPINNKSPLALNTSLNLSEFRSVLQKENIPTTISYFADTFICNYFYFNCLDYIRKNKLNIKSVFIHVPLSPEEVNNLDTNKASFPTKIIAEGITKYIIKYLK